MDHFSYLITAPYYYLLFSAPFLVYAVISTYTGKTLTRFGNRVYRAEEPSEFWWNVALYYLGGILFIGVFLYKVSN
jgi:hypothetical protein